MELNAETIQQHLPYYLTAEDREVLLDNIRDIASGGSPAYALDRHSDPFTGSMLQGDGWTGFQLFKFSTGERLSRKGIILSNSCDIDSENLRALPPWITFSPLVKLAAYGNLLEKHGLSAQRVNAIVSSIKAQETTNVFYLPAGGPLSEEHIIRFDHIYSMPLTAYAESAGKEKLFTLNNTGFYMLALKLSIHFCRLQEQVSRTPLHP